MSILFGVGVVRQGFHLLAFFVFILVCLAGIGLGYLAVWWHLDRRR
jgi:hypothetical protein